MVCSRGSTPALTPNPSSSFIHGGAGGGNNRIKAANIPLLLQLQDPSNNGTGTASISRNKSDDVVVDDDDELQNNKPLNDDC